MKKIDFGSLKGYVLPVIVGVVAIATGIQDKKTADRNEELEKKLDPLNSKLNDKES